ncbi:endonuclease/exonuclease/phosphatase family protein [Cylindrospermopsis raciborskii]|uniref:Endonuclease/exonuclease/phosphatase n=2 Tax=Cylindrospermopsis raciborskii TaxID=77022 RepID=A0A9Q5QYF0_9CYAN|nr:endonuclease/exonuclease/phosphatase family protein [Cylindrospermopsis raciborskii]MCZ2201731.1 endonuclease/exonuclease/phosphatase family protein [Cylindrospermopsis raciborskii PAMP2012]NLQ04441.1 endonuclease/exonuclease/phosphatase family protein [Cylindrospermopsis raciborskii MVCC19]OHY32077.1 endonuclease/exonuclease/phosphatase [Cylindrospermopsis raciborskii MVCC14]OPH10698.1 endonuclease/exonuclease/phosphatase [Cylindrospermopsis raciborskii CENA302]
MQITVMTFNLRCDKPDPGERCWQKRVGAIACMIENYQPELWGTQEGQPHQLRDLQVLLPDYEFVGGDRTGTGKGEHCAIFYKRGKLQLRETQDFYLSDTPEIPGSITWGTRLPRMVTWANFIVEDLGFSVTMMNTHLDHEVSRARELGAGLVSLRLMNFPTEDYLLLTGDFNAGPKSLERIILADNYRIKDVLGNLPLESQKTFHDFTGQAWDPRDTIYCDRRWQINQVIIDDQRWEGIWPSDHFPVIVKLGLTGET